MQKLQRIFWVLLGLGCAYAWPGDRYMGMGMGTYSNVGKLSIDSVSTELTGLFNLQTGALSYQSMMFFGKKHHVPNYRMTAYEIVVGYNFLNNNSFSVDYATSPQDKSQAAGTITVQGKTGVYYAANWLMGIERGDYDLYVVTSFRVENWSMTLNYDNTESNVSKKTAKTLGIGWGTHIALSDTMFGRMEYIYYLPATLSGSVNTASGTVTASNKVSQQSAVFSIMF